MSIDFIIQHHPSRSHLLAPLLEQIPGARVMCDPEPDGIPNPWRCYRACLDSITEKHSHACILQDDCKPSAGFAEAVTQIGAAHPDTPVCLFLARLPSDTRPRAAQAMKMGRRYVTLAWRNFLPVVAVLWPVAKLTEFREWATENPTLPGCRHPRSDDAMAGRWKMVTRQTVLACVPSIVEHEDQLPSLIGRQTHWGKDKGRVAAFLADDARDFDWSMP